MTWNWFFFVVLCLTFFVTKFHWSGSNILTTTLIWSKRSIFRWSSIWLIKWFIKIVFLWFAHTPHWIEHKCQIGLDRRYIFNKFCNTTLLQDYFDICSSNQSKKRKYEKNDFDEKGINWASAMNTCFTSNWCCGQNIWPRPMKFWHKKVKHSTRQARAILHFL